METIEIIKDYILIVEGIDEKFFFNALLDHMGLKEIQILPIGGKTKLKPNLKALVLSPNFKTVKSLGLVRDADDDPSSAFQSVRGALQSVNLIAPSQPLERVGNDPQISIMILPGNDRPGDLEVLCLDSVDKDSAITCVEQYFECLKKQSVPMPKCMSKAKVHTFLASRQEADRRLGEAAQAGYWPLDDLVFEQMKSFIQALVRG